MTIFTPEKLHVSRDMAGRIKLEIGDKVMLFTPETAIKLAEALLKLSGCNVKIHRLTENVLPPRRLNG